MPPFRGNPSELKLTAQKLEGWGCCMVKIAWSQLQPFLTDPPMWRTDRQTDGRNCDSICALTAYAVTRKNKWIKSNNSYLWMCMIEYSQPRHDIIALQRTKLSQPHANPIYVWTHAPPTTHWLWLTGWYACALQPAALTCSMTCSLLFAPRMANTHCVYLFSWF